MPRAAELFETANGDILLAYLLIKNSGANIPSEWITRTNKTRKKSEKDLGKLMKNNSLNSLPLLNEWRMLYQKECFYTGLHILLELEKRGKSDL
jgi:hypothetical protein